jgi:hypothetical protein
MRSDLQIQASRANGSKSRGPVSEEGKLASSRNAVKHGFLSENVLLCSENPEGFLEIVTALWDEFQPATAFEESLVDSMAVARWRQERIWNIERDTMDSGIRAAHDKNRAAMLRPAHLTAMSFGALASETRTLDLLNRYESRFDRQYLRAHRRLLEVQDRRMRNEPDNTPPPAPAISEPEKTNSAKRSQAESENAENTPVDSAPTDFGNVAAPIVIRTFHPAGSPFYKDALPPEFIGNLWPENPAVFHAAFASGHP